MFTKRSKIRRHVRTLEAQQATDWLARVAETGTDAMTTPVRLEAPPRLPTPAPAYAHVQRAPFGRRPPRAARRVIEASPTDATQELPRLPAGRQAPRPAVPRLRPVPPPLPMRRAPQPAPTALTPVAQAQQSSVGTLALRIPEPQSYAERLAAVFAEADERLTAMSGWVFNLTADDIQVTKTRFAGIKTRFADLLGAPRELIGATR